MQIQAKSSRMFEIVHQRRPLATIKFDSIWNSNARLYFGDNELAVKSTSFWGQKYQSVLNGLDRSEIKFNWRGHAEIKLHPNCEDQDFRTITIKNTNIWRSEYAISNKHGAKIAALKGKWSWRRFAYSYDVQQFELVENDFLLEALFYAILVHRIQMSQNSG